MTDGGRSMRARDADRDRVIAALDTAYTEGQLSAPEREARVGRALAARTLGDLDSLVRDLQDTDDRLPTEQRARRRGPVVAALLAALVLAGGIGLQVLGADPEPRSGLPVAVDVDPGPFPPAAAAPEPIIEAPAVPEYRPLTVPALRQFVRAYRAAFDTATIYDASFHEDGQVFFDAPYGEVSKNRLHGWWWDPVDGFQASTVGPSANVFGDGPINLRRIDLKALARNVEHARRYLNIEDPSVTVHLRYRTQFDDAPEVLFSVGNDFRETAWMTTTLKGRQLRSDPFSPEGR